MIKTVGNYESKFKNWGWKDPRTCLTISNWIEVFKEVDLIEKVNIIFVSRKSLSVARSLKKEMQYLFYKVLICGKFILKGLLIFVN